jgi:hypothetical protein
LLSKLIPLLLVFISGWLFVPTAWSQSESATKAATRSAGVISDGDLLPASIGEGWMATGSHKQMEVHKFPQPEADLYRDYGVLRITSRNYTNGKSSATVQVFTTRYPNGAYGLFTWNRGSLPPGVQEFHTGNHVLRFSSENKSDPGNLVASFPKNLAQEQSEMPPLPSHLPEQNKIAESEKYLTGMASLTSLKPFTDLKSIISFEGGAEAVTAEYSNGNDRMSLLIVDCYTPQLAADNFRKLEEHINSLPPEEKSGRLAKRIGNYVIETVGVNDLPSAQAIVNEIKYAPRVYWEGDRFTSIPYEFRPPDPLLVEETRRTGKFLTLTFLMIGLMIAGSLLIGAMAGAVFFYWRKWQRRRLGLEDAFSDAGGTLRLNLDDYLLGTEQTERKMIGKGE